MLRCFESAERNDRICDFDQLVSNFTLWNQQIFKSEWPLSKQQTFRESLLKKGFCTDWARQTSVENFGLVVVKRKKLLYCSDLLKHFSLCGSFRPAFHSNKINVLNQIVFVGRLHINMSSARCVVLKKLWTYKRNFFYENVWNFLLTLMFSLLH